MEANPVSQTAVITFLAGKTSVAELAERIRMCGYHCGGFSVPEHICDAMPETTAAAQNLGWAIGYNAIALPVAAGVFASSLRLRLSPGIAPISMSGSSVIVAVNALLLKRLRLPTPVGPGRVPESTDPGQHPGKARKNGSRRFLRLPSIKRWQSHE